MCISLGRIALPLGSLVIAALAVIAGLLTIGEASAGTGRAAAPSGASLRVALTRLVATGTAPGALAVVRDGARSVVVTKGTADATRRRAPGRGQAVRVGSVTKTFVATLVLQLVADRTLRLDDTVERWLPGMLPRGREISIRSLLQHTSGLPDHLSGPGAASLLAPLLRDPGHRFSPVELVRSVSRRPLLFPPGSGWAYSNTDYVLLGLIVEAATGRPLARTLDRRIARPLGLRHTWLAGDAFMPGASMHGYLLAGNELVPVAARRPRDVTRTDPSFTWAAGAVTSSAPDIGRFYRALLGGRLLPTSLLQEMTRARPLAGGTGYGLGLLRLDTPCGPLYGHDGETLGYTTMALATRDGRRSVVVTVNTSHRPLGGTPLVGLLASLARDTLCPASR